MLFGKQKKNDRKGPAQITLLSGEAVLYRGPLSEIPLREELIIQTSTRFFNDSNPCYIHRGAVRIRLCAELEEFLPSAASDTALAKLTEYTGLDGLTGFLLTKE